MKVIILSFAVLFTDRATAKLRVGPSARNDLSIAANEHLGIDPRQERALTDEATSPEPSDYMPEVTVNPSRTITEDEVIAAHKAWGDALVNISKTYDEQGYEAAKAVAESVLDSAYGYNYGTVLFKPTLAVAPQNFRLTRDGALSYFVGGNDDYPADSGFALKGWRDVQSYPAGILLNGITASSMGNVHFTDKDGKTIIVDKTWEYIKDDDGNLRIIVHHSSLPYEGAH